MEAMREKLRAVKLTDVVPPKQSIVLLEHNQTVGDALRALSRHKILSAPLVIAPGLEDVTADATYSGPSLVGWVDLQDVLQALIASIKEKHHHLPTSMLQLMSELEGDGRVFVDRALITLMGGEDKALMYQADAEGNLYDAIKDLFLTQRSRGGVVHRLAMFDSSGNITHILSQLDVVRWLNHNLDVLGELGSKTVEELGFTKKAVVTVEAHVPTIVAYDRMLQQHVSAAALVSEHGEMIANLSVSDLRCIQPDHLGILALPVAEFLALLHKTAYLGYSQRSSQQAEHAFFATSPRKLPSMEQVPAGMERLAEPPEGDKPQKAEEEDVVRLLYAKRTTTLKEVVQIAAENNIHRVWTLDPQGKPHQVVGVVTLTDILQLLVQQQ